MKKVRSLLIVLLTINILLSLTLLWWILNNFSEYILDVNEDNREEVVSLLKKANIELYEKQDLTKVKSKQGLGDVYLFLYYEKHTIVGDKEEVTDYIIKEGEKVGYYQEKIYNFSKITIIIIVILIILNEIIDRILNRKLKKNNTSID